MLKKMLQSELNNSSFSDKTNSKNNTDTEPKLKRAKSIESYISKQYHRFIYNKKIGKNLQT